MSGSADGCGWWVGGLERLLLVVVVVVVLAGMRLEQRAAAGSGPAAMCRLSTLTLSHTGQAGRQV